MLTDFDRKLLNVVQTELPLSQRPYAELARKLNSDEQTVIARLTWLKQQGYIRHIGAFFDSAQLGYSGTLVAVKVSPGYLEKVAQSINSYSGVTHNYEREGEYNLWFTLLTPDLTSQQQTLAAVRELEGVEKLLSMPAAKKYKVNVSFKL
jgi:DNA-binding Lrp family transcriptional regulator